jgi:hypothetical protein
LSFSWIRGRSNSIADGQLLVIEWSGQLADASPTTESELAMPAFEHVLQAHATSPEDWHWKRTDLDLVAYTTRDLAAQCVTSVVKRLSNGKPVATNGKPVATNGKPVATNGKPVATNGKPVTNGNVVTRPIVAAVGAR